MASIAKQLELDVAADGSQTAATGVFDLSAYITDRRYLAAVVTCTDSSAAFALEKGLTSARAVEADTSGGATGGHVFTANDGPWPYLAITWTGNTGTVRCDVRTVDGYPGS